MSRFETDIEKSGDIPGEKVWMIRFVFRLAAMFALAISVIMAVLDTTRTVAASALVMTPLNASWLAVSPGTRSAFETFVRVKINPLVWDGALAWVLNQPGFAVFAVLALILYAIGYRRDRPRGQFAPT
jgi:hypothetical protein